MSSAYTETPSLRSSLAQSLLREIVERLAVLAGSGERAAIDLRGLPLGPEDRAELQQALGRGEVAAQLQLAGRSEIWETAYSGVWWVRHYGAGNVLAAERVEITPVPEILVTHPDDITAAAARAREQFGAAQPEDAAEGSTHG